MGLANIAIIYKFIWAKMASKHGGTESTNQALGNVAMRGTAVLFTVTMTFIILTAPAQITFQFLLFPILCCNHSSIFLWSLITALMAFCYMSVGSKFRKELIATLRCIKTQNLTDDSRKSYQGSSVSKNTETTSP